MLIENFHYIYIFFTMMAVAIPIACTILFIRGGTISRVLASPVLLIAIFLYGHLGWNKMQDWHRGYNEQEKILENMGIFKNTGKQTLPLKEIIPFDWVAMCVLHPYAGYRYEYPPSQNAIIFLKALGAQGFYYSNDDDGSDKHLFRTKEGEIKEFNGIFGQNWKITSSSKEQKLCYFQEDAHISLK